MPGKEDAELRDVPLFGALPLSKIALVRPHRDSRLAEGIVVDPDLLDSSGLERLTIKLKLLSTTPEELSIDSLIPPAALQIAT